MVSASALPNQFLNGFKSESECAPPSERCMGSYRKLQPMHLSFLSGPNGMGYYDVIGWHKRVHRDMRPG